MSAPEFNKDELLYWAAKSIGLEYTLLDNRFYIVNGRNDAVGRVWNPINDGNDALNLMVAHGMEVYVDTHPEGCSCVEAESHTHKTGRIILNFSSDIEADTRLAITMVAARVGVKKS